MDEPTNDQNAATPNVADEPNVAPAGLKNGMETLYRLSISDGYTNAIVIAGINTLAGNVGGKYTTSDVLNGTAKMYAGVSASNFTYNVNTQAIETFTPVKWMYKKNTKWSTDESNHRGITNVETRVDDASAMFKNIIELSTSDTYQPKNPILGKIAAGTYVGGQSFQLVFLYKLDGDRVTGEGRIHYIQTSTEYKTIKVVDNVIKSTDTGETPVLGIINELLGTSNIGFAEEPAVSTNPFDGGKKTRRKRRSNKKKGGTRPRRQNKSTKKGRRSQRKKK